MTGALVTDTHPLIWWAGARQKLSARTRKAFQACTDGRLIVAAALQLGIPLISKDSDIARSGLVKMYW
jgi:PIN domain nuclease of toxin-antitoxin system